MAPRRQVKGEGSIFKRGDGKGLWVAEVSRTGPDGKRSRRCVYARTQQEASAKLKELRERPWPWESGATDQLVVIRDLAALLRMDHRDIDVVLRPFAATIGSIPAQKLWSLILAGAEQDSRALQEITDRWFEARAARKRDRITPAQRRRIIERDHYRCRYCGKPLDDPRDVQLDHVIPWGKGGQSTDENLVVCCRRCNARKRGYTLKDADMILLPAPLQPISV